MIVKGYKKGLVMHYPKSLEIEYRRQLITYVKEIKKLVREYILNNLNFTSSYRFVIKKDDLSNDLDNYIKAILEQAKDKAFFLIIGLRKLANKVNIFNKNIFSKFISSVPELTNKISEEIKMWISENTNLITNIPVLMMSKIVIAIHDSVRSSDSIAALKEEIKEIESSTDKRAKLIASDQIGKINGNIVRQRNLDLGITEYVFLTSRDEKVRPTHKVMENKVCSWLDSDVYKDAESDKKWKKRNSIGGVEKHPEEDFNCRCTSIAIIPSFVGNA